MLKGLTGRIHRLLMGNAPETEENLEATVAYGAEALRFLKSDLGQYLLDRSGDEVLEALTALETVDPGDYQKIQELQNIIRRNRSVEAWLGEVVQAGIDARNLLDDQG
jgi:hypothetical protein